jgi:hypothetical protein
MSQPEPDAPLHTAAWRNFKRMQGSACLFGSLIYLAAALRAWEALPGEPRFKATIFLIAPALFFSLAFTVPLVAGPVRRWLKKYVWMSFAAGFGQTVWSVVGGLGVLAFCAGFIFLQIAGAADGGRYPAGIFSAYASGVGILFAQAVLTRLLEREPSVRQLIER